MNINRDINDVSINQAGQLLSMLLLIVLLERVQKTSKLQLISNKLLLWDIRLRRDLSTRFSFAPLNPVF
jgi:hypothetical protein